MKRVVSHNEPIVGQQTVNGGGDRYVGLDGHPALLAKIGGHEPVDEIERYLDLPCRKPDLFYIQKMVICREARRGLDFKDGRN